MGTVRAVAKMGYQGVEFCSPYFAWTEQQAKDVHKLLDEVGMKCFSTHNDMKSFDPVNTQKAIDLNSIIGSKYIVMASPGIPKRSTGGRRSTDKLNAGNDAFKKSGINAGYHNHQTEFKPLEGKRPIEVIAANTAKDVMLQFDVGTCIEAGSDPVSWINQNPGASVRCTARTIHRKLERATRSCSAKARRTGRRFSKPPRIRVASSTTSSNRKAAP